MEFDDVKVGMVFDNEQPPRFLYIYHKDDMFIQMYPINVGVDLEEEEYSGKIHYLDWEDQFEFMEQVDGSSPERYAVFKELFG